MARQHGKKVRILNENFLLLTKQILARSLLGRTISHEGEIILLVVDYNNAETKLTDYLNNFPPEQKSNFHFLLGIPPVVGSEERLARIIDYLHMQSPEVTNLSKNENFIFGTSLVD
jgi:GTP-sensing pleiotropic transcriptional regulator CodY